MTTTVSRRATSFSIAVNLCSRGTDFLHENLVAEALKMELPEFPGTPDIPFSEKEITQAIELGQQIIWFPAKDAAGKPITMKLLYENFKNEAPLGGKLLNNIEWNQNEPFFTETPARADKSGLGSWRLVGRQAIPDTKGVNYLEQTIIGAKHVYNVIYGGNPPKHLEAILQEPAEREKEIAELIGENWRKAAEILVGLPFNQQFRETPVEALIRVIINQKVNRTRLLENEYSWTNARSLGGRLVDFGGAGSSGASLDRWGPWSSGGCIGFFLSRSVDAGSES